MDEMFENWGETKEALLEGLNGNQKKIMSPLLENQKDYLLAETAAGQPSGSTAAQDIAGFRKILIPMIRRVIPGTIAPELIGVQPMSGPVGLVYSLRYRYGEAAIDNGRWPSNVAGNQNVAVGDEAFGNQGSGGVLQSPYLRSFYSGGIIDGGSPAGTTPVQAYPTAGEADPVAQLPGQSGLGGVDTTGVEFAADIANALTSGEGWGSTLDALSGCTIGGSGSTIEGSGGRKMSLEVVSQAVEARSRKLQASWTIEAMQDLNAQHGLDLESEMTQGLSAEIVQEIDSEVIGDLLALAGTVATFDGAGSGVYGGGAGGNYAPAYIGDRLANLGVLVNFVANEIGRRTRRGTANYMVASPMVVSVLQAAAKSVFAPAVSGSFKGPNNTMLVGTLNGTIKVYSYLWNSTTPNGLGSPSSPWGPSVPTGVATDSGNDEILLGYKGGNGEADSGYFYAPYIPLMSSGVIVNPDTFQPVISLMTRYGKTSFTNRASSLGNSRDYYGKIIVNALDLS
jgi:hypothetical protein